MLGWVGSQDFRRRYCLSNTRDVAVVSKSTSDVERRRTWKVKGLAWNMNLRSGSDDRGDDLGDGRMGSGIWYLSPSQS